MQFWFLEEPDYESDYDSAFVNGELEHPFGLPGMRCSTCRNTWSGSRKLPIELPTSLRIDKRFTIGSPVSSADFRRIEEDLRKSLQPSENLPPRFEPGDAFQPSFLDVPSFPMSDFLWCSIGSFVVSLRVKELLEHSKITTVILSRVTPRRIGTMPPGFPAPIASTGEPEDIIDEVELLDDLDQVPPYFEMVVTAQSARPPGSELIHVCDDCGHEQFDANRRRLVMRPDMWNGDEVFLLATTCRVLVTDRVKKLLEGIDATNVQFSAAPG